jgi:hypothetical protein
MARLNPEVVVFFIGTNDFSAVSGDWKDGYAATVDSMMKTLIGSGRTVYWLGAPTLKDEDKDRAVVQVNSVFQDVAKRHRQVHYVDAHKLFADTDGSFAADLPDATGKLTTMRAGDGVHLTVDGATYLAGAVYTLVDAQCAITEQKVDGETKAAIETAGSTQVAPGSSSNSNSSGSIQTTPPATAATTTPPVVTSPPVTDPPTTTAPATTSAPPTTVGGTSSK